MFLGNLGETTVEGLVETTYRDMIVFTCTYQKLSKVLIGNIGEFDTMELWDDELREVELPVVS